MPTATKTPDHIVLILFPPQFSVVRPCGLSGLWTAVRLKKKQQTTASSIMRCDTMRYHQQTRQCFLLLAFLRRVVYRTSWTERNGVGWLNEVILEAIGSTAHERTWWGHCIRTAVSRSRCVCGCGVIFSRKAVQLSTKGQFQVPPCMCLSASTFKVHYGW